MKKFQKLILPAIFALVLALLYFTYFAPTKELGDFSKFGGSEINQNINVRVVKSRNDPSGKGFEKDANGNIISFYAADKNNVEVKVTSHEPIPAEIANAKVVELLGHMHENNFVAAKINLIEK